VSLGLAIESSSISYGVAVGFGPEVIEYRAMRRDHPDFVGVGSLVSGTIAAAGYRFDQVDFLAVDAGPGNLSSVRAGVSYVNGLAFSLGRPVLPVNSLEALAHATGVTDVAVLCLRNAGGGNVYAGLYRAGGMLAIRHGRLAEVAASIAAGQAEIAVAGVFREEARAALTGVTVRDTGLEFPDAVTLYHRLSWAVANGGARSLVPFATPLTEASTLFGGVGDHEK
jgi:tRNA threonylcarbamoyladenosine biosynthesis protein TsaB